MPIIKKKVTDTFKVVLTEAEIREKQEELVDQITEHVELHTKLDSAANAVKMAKDDIKGAEANIRQTARVCRDGHDYMRVVDAEVELDTATWIERVYRPEDRQLLRERTVVGEERKALSQTVMFKDEMDEEQLEREARTKTSPALKVAAGGKEG